eukprot:1290772-Pleurochrysis_carterae.AAC.1
MRSCLRLSKNSASLSKVRFFTVDAANPPAVPLTAAHRARSASPSTSGKWAERLIRSTCAALHSSSFESTGNVIYRTIPSSRSKAARGPSRSLGPTHARLSHQACSYNPDSLPLIYQSYHPAEAGSDDII